MTEQELMELLAASEHDSWARWMRYLFSKCEFRADGRTIIPPELMGRWARQSTTSYAQLSEQEKQSDRDEVTKILPLIRAFAQKRQGMDEEKERLIQNVIVWNLDLNCFDDDDGETELVKWILKTHRHLQSLAPEALAALQRANSLADGEEEESEGDSHE